MRFIFGTLLASTLAATPIWELDPHFVHYRGLELQQVLYEMEILLKSTEGADEVVYEETFQAMREYVQICRGILGIEIPDKIKE